MKINNITSTVKATKYMFFKIWKQGGGKSYIFIKVILAILNAFFPVIISIIPGLIINELIKRELSNTIIIYAILLVTIPIVNRIVNILLSKQLFNSTQKLTQNNLKEFYQHVTKMDYETLEKPEIQDKKNRAVDILGNNFVVVDYLCNFISAIIKLVLISSVVSFISPFIILLMIIITIISSIISKKLDKKKYEINKVIQSKERKQWGVNYMLDMFQYAKELRLFKINDYLIHKLLDSEKDIDAEKKKILDSNNNADLLYTFLNFLNQAVLYVYLIYRVIWEGLLVGSMTIFLSATSQFSGAISSVTRSYLNLTSNALKINDYIEFISIPLTQYVTGDKDPTWDENSVIEFKGVSFKYPGSDIYALKNVNIILHANKKLCIVGMNGAGKTTFIKLLTRLYFPTEGEILLNGENINEYNYEKYQRLFAPVFQDFSKFYMTLGENIVLANDYDKDKLDYVCKSSGIFSLVEKLPKGYNTQVDKWVDAEGIEPSGGENQRIAIARACYHGGDIFLLDEPTAALDPMAEYEIYAQFNKMITDKCAVLITHRLSAVQLADKVAVFDNGSVVEYGTHKELYEKGGIYTEMFDKQAQFYRDEKSSDN